METKVQAVLTGRVASFGPKGELSGYAKQVQADAVELAPLGFSGDEQADLVHHGGVDKAVHHYAFDHYPLWAAEQPELATMFNAPGAFGENISTTGWGEGDICIGDRFRMGTALIEVSQGRQPCWKLGHYFRNPAMVERVISTGRCGWYYRVIEAGKVTAGDVISLQDRVNPQWDVLRVFRILIGRVPTPRHDVLTLGSLPELSASWRVRCQKLAETLI